MMRILDTLGRKLIACWAGCALALIGTLVPWVSDSKFLAAVGAISTMTCTYIVGNAMAARKGSSSVESVVVTHKETKDAPE